MTRNGRDLTTRQHLSVLSPGGVGFNRRKCEGHNDAVRVLAVANGKVFSGSYDGSIGVW